MLRCKSSFLLVFHIENFTLKADNVVIATDCQNLAVVSKYGTKTVRYGTKVRHVKPLGKKYVPLLVHIFKPGSHEVSLLAAS